MWMVVGNRWTSLQRYSTDFGHIFFCCSCDFHQPNTIVTFRLTVRCAPFYKFVDHKFKFTLWTPRWSATIFFHSNNNNNKGDAENNGEKGNLFGINLAVGNGCFFRIFFCTWNRNGHIRLHFKWLATKLREGMYANISTSPSNWVLQNRPPKFVWNTWLSTLYLLCNSDILFYSVFHFII